MNRESITLRVDAESVNRLLRDLAMTRQETRRAFRQAMRAGAGIVARQAKQNLRGAGKGTRRLVTFVRTKVNRNVAGATVSIAQNRRRKYEESLRRRGRENKSHVLKWVEGGTAARYVRRRNGKLLERPKYVGRMKAHHFLEHAERSKGEQAAQESGRLVEKYIRRVASRRDTRKGGAS